MLSACIEIKLPIMLFGFAPILHLLSVTYATNKFITHISTVTIKLTSAHLYINLQLPIGASGINIGSMVSKLSIKIIIINFRGA